MIAIIGRTNVGKSAVFNRLVGKRLAIVHDEKGVTRDRIVCQTMWEGRSFGLIDTGGIVVLDRKHPDDIAASVFRHVESALAEAAVIFLVVDIKAGLHPLDEEAAALARRTSKHVLVLANKSDNHEQDKLSGEFEELGFPVFPVSALHNRGFDALMPKALSLLPSYEVKKETASMRIAIVGRPNVGKSSLINKLLKEERVIVSPMPGTTRDSILVPFEIKRGRNVGKYEIVDTAGLRYEHKVKSAVEHYSRKRAEESILLADIVLLVLDAVQGPTTQDKKIASLIVEAKKGCAIIVNKWDLAKKISQKQYIKAVSEVMPFLNHCPVLCVSAISGYNVDSVLDLIDHIGSLLNTSITTGILNRVLQDAYEEVNPPTIAGKLLRIFYATQTKKKPPSFTVFVNDPYLVTDEYHHYLQGTVRSSFDLYGVPVIMKFKARR